MYIDNFLSAKCQIWVGFVLHSLFPITSFAFKRFKKKSRLILFINCTWCFKQGYRADSSSVEPTSSSRCIFTAQKRWTLGRYGFGDDTYVGNTVDILKDISGEYGAITSFTGYKDLKADPIPHIILKVGGNPLAVIPANFTVRKLNYSLNL